MAAEVVDLFLELAALPSPPGDERAVADVVTRYLRDLGLSVEEDDAGEKVGSNMGNLFCRVEPSGGGTPIFLCAHLDTVPPEGPIDPVVEDGVVRNAGGTILGADNKSAVAAMLEGTRRVLAESRPHGGLELLFTPQEEVGLLGAAAFDHERLRAHVGYVYDQAAAIGDVILGAPHSQAMQVRFHGRAAHSGMYPEEGRSAIAAEARSHDERKLADLVQEMVDAFSFAAGLEDCEVETKVSKSYRGYRFKRDDPVVRFAHAALERAGYTPNYGLSGGAADANVFNERGLACLNLANGMQDIHTPDERITVEDLEGMVEVTLALVDVARDVDA